MLNSPEFKLLLNEFYIHSIKHFFSPKRMKTLKIMQFLGLVASRGGTISSARKLVFEKSVAKTVTRKVLSPKTRINTGFFGTSKPRGTTPTRSL